ncbi:MAG: hypothetical protein WBP79_07095 [Candidatus Acidiferrales bacterium]
MAAIFAVGMLCAGISFGQDAKKDQSNTQDKSATADRSSAPDKSNSQDKKPSDSKSSDSLTTKLRIQVMTKDDKPVGNAAVYVRYNTPGGLFHKDKLTELDFKTNQDGSVKTPELPRGKILIQVIAKGWHTYGKWFDIDKDEAIVEIKLEPPTKWY